MLLDSIFFNNTENESAITFTLGTESVNLEELSSSLFLCIMLIVYYMPIAMLLAHRTFRNLAVMFRITLLSGTATALCYDGAGFDTCILFWQSYVGLFAYHMFLKVSQVPFVLRICKRILNLHHIKYVEKRGSGNPLQAAEILSLDQARTILQQAHTLECVIQ